jgi:hypothetical protein
MERIDGALKDLPALIAACAKAKVVRFKLGDMEILFADHGTVLGYEIKSTGTYGNMSESGFSAPTGEVSADDEADIKQQTLDELMISDPELYEQQLLGDDNYDVRGRPERDNQE